jgi:hypothetical protein
MLSGIVEMPKHARSTLDRKVTSQFQDICQT